MIRQLIITALLCGGLYCQATPSEDYYRQNITAEQTPADYYYNNNLRAAGPEPEGPGGGSEGDGEFVGGEPKPLPVGEVSAKGILLMGVAALLYKKRNNKQ